MIREQSASESWKNVFQYASVIGPLALGLLLCLIGFISHSSICFRSGGLVMVTGFACGLFVRRLRGYRFTFWILIANFSALLSPISFKSIGQLDLNNPWLLLVVVQLIMFGMGTQMSIRDFASIAKMPYAVLVGLGCQFLIMPLLGYSLAKLLQFPDEIAAGVILIGSCSSGLASNVMTFLARGNLALSVAITALATMLAPILTPMWMKVLASSFIEVDAVAMSLDIVKMVIVPILAAFVHDWLSAESRRLRYSVGVIIAISLVWICYLGLGGWSTLESKGFSQAAMQAYSIMGFFAAAFVFGFLYHQISRLSPEVEQWMPMLSMTGIVFFTLVTTAHGSDHLKEVGLLLLLAALLHNTLGYFLGYWGGRLLGLSLTDAKTVAIEVGTQNGSMGIGIAKSLDKLATVGLASIIFVPLMNVTGSILANYWRRTADGKEAATKNPGKR